MQKDWKDFYEIKNGLGPYDRYAQKIINSLGDCLNDFFIKGRTDMTQILKVKLTEIGQSFGFKSYSNKLPFEMTQAGGGNEKNKEWMWDIHWYTEDSVPYTPITIPMVGEIEWENNEDNRSIRYSSVMDDFQKLVVTNAEMRLLVFCLMDEKDFSYLNHYFENLIFNKYQHFQGGEKFLLIAYYKPKLTFYVREMIAAASQKIK